jgi:hypothetical protein
MVRNTKREYSVGSLGIPEIHIRVILPRSPCTRTAAQWRTQGYRLFHYTATGCGAFFSRGTKVMNKLIYPPPHLLDARESDAGSQSVGSIKPQFIDG